MSFTPVKSTFSRIKYSEQKALEPLNGWYGPALGICGNFICDQTWALLPNLLPKIGHWKPEKFLTGLQDSLNPMIDRQLKYTQVELFYFGGSTYKRQGAGNTRFILLRPSWKSIRRRKLNRTFVNAHKLRFLLSNEPQLRFYQTVNKSDHPILLVKDKKIVGLLMPVVERV